jgi:hypothetical protein
MVRSKASILTASQRQYLLDGTKLSEDEPVSNPYEYNKEIRQRLSHTLMDLGLLFREMDEAELREVFGENFSEIEGVTDNNGGEYDYCRECEDFVESTNHNCANQEYGPHWYSSGPGAFAFLAWALNVADDPIYPPYSESQPAFEHFEQLVGIGISKYLTEKHNLLANVSVSIELSDVDRVDELYPEND